MKTLLKAKGLLRARAVPEDIVTERLLLRSISVPALQAEARGAGAVERAVKAVVSAEWPPEHWDAAVRAVIQKQFDTRPQTIGWHRYVLLPQTAANGRAHRPLLIGCCGAFPRERGDVEIGYSTLPAYQRHGYATEAVNALVNWMLLRAGVSSVSAQTFARMPESIKVMERCGMMYAGLGDQPGTVRYRRAR